MAWPFKMARFIQIGEICWDFFWGDEINYPPGQILREKSWIMIGHGDEKIAWQFDVGDWTWANQDFMAHVIFGFWTLLTRDANKTQGVPCKSSGFWRHPVFARDHSSRFFFKRKWGKHGDYNECDFFCKSKSVGVWLHSGKLTYQWKNWPGLKMYFLLRVPPFSAETSWSKKILRTMTTL